ncbi:hypothetical protein RB601_005791 [Gaeumannomyces tritici]
MFARSLARALARPLGPAAPLQLRRLHASARLRATTKDSPTPEELMANPKMRDLFTKVSKHPAVLEAIAGLGEILQRHGIGESPAVSSMSLPANISDAHSGQRPGMVQMAKVLVDKDFREASQKLKDEMDKAGIDTQEFATLAGLGKE